MDENGYYKKFEIKRTDGTPLEKDEEHFVLSLTSDKAAREAALYYAHITGNGKLENDLLFLYSRLHLQYDSFYEMKAIQCINCGESASDVGVGDKDLIGELVLDPGSPSSRYDPGEPAVPLFICHKCKGSSS